MIASATTVSTAPLSANDMKAAWYLEIMALRIGCESLRQTVVRDGLVHHSLSVHLFFLRAQEVDQAVTERLNSFYSRYLKYGEDNTIFAALLDGPARARIDERIGTGRHGDRDGRVGSTALSCEMRMNFGRWMFDILYVQGSYR